MSSLHLNTPSTLLVFLDRYHLGDPLFLSSFARDVKAHVGPLILVHGSGEEAERVLEARGFLTKEERSGPVARQLVERAIRDLNRRIVHELNDAAVPAVGVFGVDRALLQRSGRGDIEAGKVDWLVALARQGGIPVLGGLVRMSANEFTEADPAQVLVALSQAVEAVVTTVVISVGWVPVTTATTLLSNVACSSQAAIVILAAVTLARSNLPFTLV